MLDVLHKKATGYEVQEMTQEFTVDDEGNRHLSKEKVSTKYVPPDLSAIKTYLEIKNSELYSMSNEDLAKEKKRLLKKLKKPK